VGQAVLTLAGLNVLLAAEAKAGMQVKAIAEDRMKVMRRMWTSLWFSSTATFGSSSRLMGSDMPDFGFGRCDGHHERSISGSEKSVPAKHQQSKRLRCAAIAFSYRRYVA
jgi:hypothetical protein